MERRRRPDLRALASLHDADEQRVTPQSRGLRSSTLFCLRFKLQNVDQISMYVRSRIENLTRLRASMQLQVSERARQG